MAIDDQLLQDQINQALSSPAPTMPRATPDDGTRPGWTGLLGEVLGGGQSPGYQLRGHEADTSGNRALLNFGIQTLLASGPSPVRPDVFSAVASGLQGAQQSMDLDQRRAMALAQQDYTNRSEAWKQKIEGIKAAVPLLTLQQQLQQQQAVRNMPSSLGSNTTGAVGGDGLTGDKTHDLPLIAQRESGGNPTKLNYVATEDPTAYARGATASGKYQIVNSTWAEGMRLAGIDPSKYATARDAPESVQDQVASALFDKHGNTPWQKGAQDWVKGADGRYTLQAVAKPAGAPPAPGAPTTATATTTPPAGPPGVLQGSPGDRTPPPPPGAPAGPYAGGGIGTALNPTVPRETQVFGPDGKVRTVVQPVPATKPGGKVAGDVAVMQQGMQLAQATPSPPSVLAAGPAAGGAPTTTATATPAAPPAPQPGWGSVVGTYGSGTAPTPQATTQAPPASVPGVTTPPPAPAPSTPGGGPPTFAYVRHDPPPGMLQGAELTPAEQSVVQDARNAYANAVRVAITPEQRQQAEATLQATLDKELGARAGRTDAAGKQMADWYANDFKQQQEAHKLATDSYYKNQDQQQQLENQLRIETAKGEQTRLTNKEAVFNQANQKGLETAQTEQAAARDTVAQLEGFRAISDGVGQPNWLQTTKFPGTDQTIAERLGQLGIKLDDTGGVQLLRGAMTNMVRTLRQGMAMGSLSDRDLDFIQRMGPTEWMDPDTRAAAVGYLQQAYRAKMRFSSDVQKEMSRGKNYGDAVDAADAKQKPFVPAVPADLSLHWRDQTGDWPKLRQQWTRDNDVRPGTLYHMANGTIAIARSPKQGEQ